MDKDFPRLLRLSNTSLTLERSADDVRGHAVMDSAGEQIGTVHDLFIDEDERRVRFLEVSSGGFLGIGADRSLIPIDAIEKIDERGVHLTHGREHVAGAPPYDPDLVDQDYYTNLYGYYGYGPFWSSGYMYPTFPYYL